MKMSAKQTAATTVGVVALSGLALTSLPKGGSDSAPLTQPNDILNSQQTTPALEGQAQHMASASLDSLHKPAQWESLSFSVQSGVKEGYVLPPNFIELLSQVLSSGNQGILPDVENLQEIASHLTPRTHLKERSDIILDHYYYKRKKPDSTLNQLAETLRDRIGAIEVTPHGMPDLFPLCEVMHGLPLRTEARVSEVGTHRGPVYGPVFMYLMRDPVSGEPIEYPAANGQDRLEPLIVVSFFELDTKSPLILEGQILPHDQSYSSFFVERGWQSGGVAP